MTHFYGVRQSGLPLLETLIADDNTSDRAVSDHAASDRAASGGAGSVRTYKIVRAVGSASSHALDILKKYRLDPESLRVRMKAVRQREGGDE